MDSFCHKTVVVHLNSPPGYVVHTMFSVLECVETLVILRAKFHVVSSLLNVLKIAILKTKIWLILKVPLLS